MVEQYDELDWSHTDRTVTGNQTGSLSVEAGKMAVRAKGTNNWDRGL